MASTTIPTSDPAVRGALEAAELALQEGAPLLILGEPGTGKTTLARHLHQRLDRGVDSFLHIECAAPGAAQHFGVAARRRADAVRGTLFVDDLELLAPHLQERLYEFICAVRRDAPRSFRLIGAACQTLPDLAARGSFSPQLHASFAEHSILLPALRERRGDIPAWVAQIGGGAAGSGARVSEAAMGYLVEYDWPGNLRELEGLMQRFQPRSAGRGIIAAEDLPPQIRWFAPHAFRLDPSAGRVESPSNPMAEEFQYHLIADALRRTWRR